MSATKLSCGAWPMRCAAVGTPPSPNTSCWVSFSSKYISDAFEEQHAKLDAERAQGADPEDPDEYRAQNIFWVPPEARWVHLQPQAKQSTIGQVVDEAMTAIE